MTCFSGTIWGRTHQREQRTRFRLGFDLAQAHYIDQAARQRHIDAHAPDTPESDKEFPDGNQD